MLKKIKGKVENNPIWKFRVFWEALTQDERHDMWSILTALRAQDENGDFDVKHCTTGRIRKELFMEHGMPYPALVFSPPLDYEDEIVNIREAYRKAPFHFQTHICEAINALGKYVFKGRLKDIRKVVGLDRS